MIPTLESLDGSFQLPPERREEAQSTGSPCQRSSRMKSTDSFQKYTEIQKSQ